MPLHCPFLCFHFSPSFREAGATSGCPGTPGTGTVAFRPEKALDRHGSCLGVGGVGAPGSCGARRDSPLSLSPGAFPSETSQITPASSLWRQLCLPTSCSTQSARDPSAPVHPTLSRWMGPSPSPK